jgi:site-specific DNA-methyltransferase (adenine-specific)/site-specific DNA-methyltransferase (cytosine-N4-specific)
VEWFLPRSAEFLRVLKPTGSFVLNIKERVVKSERHTYVLELIIAMRNQDVVDRRNIYGIRRTVIRKWPNRFRDSWERLLHFTKSKHFAMYQDEVMVPMGDWQKPG